MKKIIFTSIMLISLQANAAYITCPNLTQGTPDPHLWQAKALSCGSETQYYKVFGTSIETSPRDNIPHCYYFYQKTSSDTPCEYKIRGNFVAQPGSGNWMPIDIKTGVPGTACAGSDCSFLNNSE